MVQFRGFQVHIWGFSVHLSRQFLVFFEYLPGMSGVWEPRQGVGCILRTVPPPKKIVCPGLAMLVVHEAGPFRQISGMGVGENGRSWN